MSKAFTKDDADDPGVERPAPRREAGEKRPMTAAGFRSMHQELARLVSEERPRAQALPPLEAAGRIKDIDSRARLLAATLDAVTVVHPQIEDPLQATFGLWITLEDERGSQRTYRLVGADEADPKSGRISVQSPLGRSLLGKRVGDSAEVDRPLGTVEYTVRRIHQDEERAF